MTDVRKLIEEMAELTERARKYLSQSKDKKMKSYDPNIYDGVFLPRLRIPMVIRWILPVVHMILIT